jgi:uncharacterized membrane protein
MRSDVVFLCLIYPVVGIVLAGFTLGYDILPMLFPLAAGFALIGPLAAVHLYELDLAPVSPRGRALTTRPQVARCPGIA